MTNGGLKVQNEILMEKRVLTFLIVLSVFITSTSFVLAVGDNSTREEKKMEVQERIEDKKEALEEKREEMRKRVEERKATKEAEIKEKRGERIKHYWELLGKRIQATIERLEKLIGRIESRLAKIKEANPEKDFSSVEANIKEAKELLADAEAKYDEAGDALEDLLESEDPKNAFKKLREDIKDIKDILSKVHRILVHVIGDIKGLRVGQTGNQPEVSPTITLTTTPTLTPTPTPTPTPTSTVTPTP